MEGMWWLSYCWIATGISSMIGSMLAELMLAGETDDLHDSSDEYDADDWLRVGGDKDGVRDGNREEPHDDVA